MWTDQWTGKTIGAALSEAARRYGERVAMVFEDGPVSFSDLHKTSGLVARAFLNLGVKRGDTVAIWMAGYVEWAYLYYGLARIGAVMVPVNTRFKPEEVEYILNKSRARLLVFKDEPQRKDYLAVLNELCPEIGAGLGTGAVSRLPNLQELVAVSNRQLPGCVSFSEFLAAASTVPEEKLVEAERRVKSEDTALLQFTSGTTAMPKGAMLYHMAMLRGAYYCSQPLRLSEEDRFFSPQPFFHAGGSIQVMLAPVVTGCTMIVQAYFDPAEALRLMEEYRCSTTMGHQPHYIEYLNHPDLKKRRLKLEKGMIFASPDVNRRVYEELGIRFLISPYGLTETHLSGTSCRMDDNLEKRLATVGRTHPGVELGIRAPDGPEFLSRGEKGEVCIHGWGIMKGYFDDPVKTEAVLDRDGWLRTGDLGAIDSDGYLQLIGRIKDMIRVGGENVAAADVEAFLLRHEKVKQAVAVGAPDSRLGEVCVAFIELKRDAEATQADIIRYCQAGLASFKVPRQVRFVREWPMSGTGKIQRFLLKESLAANTDR
ncbi:MAG: AMP-binding protein [Deltaproteobacteria bacterium]|nr:AMP-binding protein [Deltaproteobacteria bacterium]